MHIVWTHHAQEQLAARKISKELVEEVLQNPQQIVQDVVGNPVAQSRYFDVHEGQEMLLRVFYVEEARMKRITTVYKTSQVRRY